MTRTRNAPALYVQDMSHNDFVEPDGDIYTAMLVTEHVETESRRAFMDEYAACKKVTQGD